jgi:drug/metabolite transporter (DMT)-like permease
MASLSARHPQHVRALLMLLLANAFWGLSFPTIKAVVLVHEALLPGSTHWFITAMSVTPRYILAALVMWLWQARRLGQTTRGELRQGLELGLFASFGTILQNDGLQFTSASTSAFLTQLYAVLIPALVAVRLRRSPGARVWLCGILVLVGVALLGHFDWRTLSFGRGEWETLACSLFFMGQILCLERREFTDNDPLRITLVMFTTQAVVFSGLLLCSAPGVTAVFQLCSSWPWVGLTLALTLTCTLGAFLLMNTWQPKITATEAGLIYCFEPIFGSLLALFLPALFSVWGGIAYANETATRSLLIGGGLITVANVLLQLRPPPKV